jgi:hypothetical protein
MPSSERQLMANTTLERRPFPGMDAELGRRQSEDQPPPTGLDVLAT